MTPLPKKKRTRSRSNMRRNTNSKSFLPNLVKCAKCGHLRWPHTACPACGYYK